MPDTQTAHYNFTKPENGASEDTWGAKLNQNWDDADAAIKAAKDQADAGVSAAATAQTAAGAAQATADAAQAAANAAQETADSVDFSGVRRFSLWIGG